jgi:hypothetical protein
VHPLRVESVAWVAERKDLLCGTFFLLAAWAHAVTVRGGLSRKTGLALCAVAMALGALSKGMIVTLPCVLLLLDWWPLRRLAWSPGGPAGPPASVAGLIVEKVPLFAISAAACWMTVWSQEQAIATVADVPLWLRLAGASTNVVDYLGMFLAPVNLAGFYPWDSARLTPWRTVASLAVIVAVTSAGVAVRDRQPRLLVGWLWFLGMLVPVSGVVQVGRANLADRFTYLPQIGLAWACVGIGVDMWNGLIRRFVPHGSEPRGRVVGVAVAMAVLAPCATLSYVQAMHWRDTETFWRRSLACAARNPTAHLNLGMELRDQGRLDEAIRHLAAAHALEPDAVDVLQTLGLALSDAGRLEQAHECLMRALAIDPENLDVLVNVGVNAARGGRIDEATAVFERVLVEDPGNGVARSNLTRVRRVD